jgi:hypothetical protein
VAYGYQDISALIVASFPGTWLQLIKLITEKQEKSHFIVDKDIPIFYIMNMKSQQINQLEKSKMPNEIPKSATCGCCTNGCVCNLHMDIPRGMQPSVCEYHARLPYHPIDKQYRWDARQDSYLRIPQGVPADPDEPVDFGCPVCGWISCDHSIVSPPTCPDCNKRMEPVNSTLRLLLGGSEVQS